MTLARWNGLDLRELRDHLSYHHNVPVGPVSILEDAGRELLAEHARQPHRRPGPSHLVKHAIAGVDSLTFWPAARSRVGGLHAYEHANLPGGWVRTLCGKAAAPAAELFDADGEDACGGCARAAKAKDAAR